MTSHRVVAEFLDGVRGRILVVARIPAVGTSHAVLVVPPFAEEMNKSRRMIAEIAVRLAEAGVATIVPDLFGTGDSEGDFSEGDWTVWLRDLECASDWSARMGWPVDRLLAIRLGCPLAADALRSASHQVVRTVFWAPVLDGERYLTQFLRLRVAASMMGGSQTETVAGLRSRIANGETLEVAGYPVAPSLARHIEQVRLVDECGPNLGELHWMEVVRTGSAGMPGGVESAMEKARRAGTTCFGQSVTGDPFWASTEIVINPDLLRKTVAVLAGGT